MSGEIVYMKSAIHGTRANGSLCLKSNMPSRNAFPIAVRLFRSSTRSISPTSSRMRHAIYATGSEAASRPIATAVEVCPMNSIDMHTDERTTNAAAIAVVTIAPVLYPISAVILPSPAAIYEGVSSSRYTRVSFYWYSAEPSNVPIAPSPVSSGRGEGRKGMVPHSSAAEK